MFFWNSLAFSMIHRMLAIWSLVPLPFLKLAWTSGSSWFTYCWSLAWRILSITLPSMWDECNCWLCQSLLLCGSQQTMENSSRDGNGFSSSHVWMWELYHKEGWAPKNWCFWTMVIEKILDSPLDSKEIQTVHPKGNQSLNIYWQDWCWSWNSST